MENWIKTKKRRGVVNLKGLPFMFYLIITSPKQPKLRFFQEPCTEVRVGP